MHESINDVDQHGEQNGGSLHNSDECGDPMTMDSSLHFFSQFSWKMRAYDSLDRPVIDDTGEDSGLKTADLK